MPDHVVDRQLAECLLDGVLGLSDLLEGYELRCDDGEFAAVLWMGDTIAKSYSAIGYLEAALDVAREFIRSHHA